MSVATTRLRVGTVTLVMLSALAIAAAPGAAQSVRPDMSVTIDRFVGAWELVDWRATTGSGEVRFPYGEEAQGQITYTGGRTDERAPHATARGHFGRSAAVPVVLGQVFVGRWGPAP